MSKRAKAGKSNGSGPAPSKSCSWHFERSELGGSAVPRSSATCLTAAQKWQQAGFALVVWGAERGLVSREEMIGVQVRKKELARFRRSE